MIGYTIRSLAWSDEEAGSIDLPRRPMRILLGYGSGLARRAGDPVDIVWAVGDRGPNLKAKTLVERYGLECMRALEAEDGAKVMPRLDLGPAVARLRIREDRVELLSSHRLLDGGGDPVSGLPVPGGEHARCEPAFDLSAVPLEPDPSGLDTEGICALSDGSFWIGDEFGPSLVRVDAAGAVRARHVPQGVDLAGARYPVHHSLPAIASKRQINRGFEALALSPDEKHLFLAFQSPLAHPDQHAHETARHVRIWKLDAASLDVLAQYAYPLDPPDSFRRDTAEGDLKRSDLKVSELAAIGEDSLLVLERGSETTKLYRVDLAEVASLPSEHLDPATRPTLEERSSAGEQLPALAKALILSTDDVPEIAPDLEGMAILSPTRLLLVNDNDFGVEGAETKFYLVDFDEPVLG